MWISKWLPLEWLRNKQNSNLKVTFSWSDQFLHILNVLSLLNFMFYCLSLYFPIPYLITYVGFLQHHCWVVKISSRFNIDEALPAVTIVFEVFFKSCSFHHNGQNFPIITKIIYSSLFFLLIRQKKMIRWKFYSFVDHPNLFNFHFWGWVYFKS